MKKIKKAAALAVAAALTASNVMIFSTSAEKGPLKAAAVPDVETVVAGDVVTVAINITENPGVVSWHYYLKYDADAFSLNGTPKGETLSQTYDAGGESATATSVLTFGPTTANPLSFSWSDPLYTDYYNTGKVATFKFKAKDDIQPGTYQFELITKDPEDFFDFDYTDIATVCTPGKVVVTQAVTGVNVAPASIDFAKVGDTETITATVTPDNATNKKVTFKSGDESIATVDETGLVTAVGEGTTTITVTTDDGGFTKTVNVAVAHTHVKNETVAAVAPTCQKEGNIEYFKCKCGQLFKDEACTQATTLEEVTLAKTAHNFVEKVDSQYLVSAATCTNKAVYKKSCSMCGEAGTDTFEYGEVDKTNHVGETEIKDAKEATCEADGYTGDTYCKACGDKIADGQIIPRKQHIPSNEWKYDETDHWKVCTFGCGTIMDKAAHSGGTATCTKKAVCEVCGQEYGEVDKTNHGKTKTVGYVAATAETDGYSGDLVCVECGDVIKAGSVIPKHAHEWTKVEAADPSCTEDGHKEYYVCEVCLAVSADAEGTKIYADENEALADLTVPALGHDLVANDGAAPSCTEPGLAAHYDCSRCHKHFIDDGADPENPSYTEVTEEELIIPALGHDCGEEWFYDTENHWQNCARCEQNVNVEAHTFGEWVENPQEDGSIVRERTCTKCGFHETETIPAPTESDSEADSTSDSETESKGGEESSKPSEGSKGGNPATGAASAFAVVTAVALGAMFITKRRK